MAIARRSLPARLGLYLAAAIIAVYSAFPIYWMVISESTRADQSTQPCLASSGAAHARVLFQSAPARR